MSILVTNYMDRDEMLKLAQIALLERKAFLNIKKVSYVDVCEGSPDLSSYEKGLKVINDKLEDLPNLGDDEISDIVSDHFKEETLNNYSCEEYCRGCPKTTVIKVLEKRNSMLHLPENYGRVYESYLWD